MFDVSLGTNVLDLNTKIKGEKKKAKTNTWDFISLKSFCKAKETINKVKKNQPTKWEKILANHVSDEGLIFKLCKEVIQPNSQKRKQVIQV